MIETIIKQIAEKIPPNSGASLRGFTLALDYTLQRSSDIISSYKVSRTEIPHRLVTVRAQIAHRVTDLQIVDKTIENVWSEVTYRYFEASSYQYYKEAAVFRFVTIISNEEFFISGAIVLEGEKYHSLISDHLQKFEQSYESLPSMVIPED